MIRDKELNEMLMADETFLKLELKFEYNKIRNVHKVSLTEKILEELQ